MGPDSALRVHLETGTANGKTMFYRRKMWIISPRAQCSIIFLLCGISYISGSQGCADQCHDCSSDGRCRHCNPGYYGVYCTPCSPFCNMSLCILDLCDNGCVEGRYGYSCDQNCSYCPHGCDQWFGVCSSVTDSADTTLSTLYGWDKKDIPLRSDYKVLIGALSIEALIILALSVLIVKGKRNHYKPFRVVSRAPKRKTKQTIFANRAVGAPIWKTAPDISPSQMTSSFSMKSTTSASNIGGRSEQDVERMQLVPPTSEIRIVVSPPQDRYVPESRRHGSLLH